jgi:hypothetical protein
MASDALPVCDHAAEVERLDGQRVRLLGVYRPVPTLKKMPRPGASREEVELGEVVIVLEGSASQYDPTAADGEPAQIGLGTAVRATGEIAQFRDRRVTVDGRLTVKSSGSSARAASQKPAPVLHEPADLRLAE